MTLIEKENTGNIRRLPALKRRELLMSVIIHA